MPTGQGYFIHQRRLTFVPIYEHATHLVAHADDFNLDAEAIAALELNPLLERDREVLIIAAGMNGWARVRSDAAGLHCEMWGPWRIAPAIVREIARYLEAGPFTHFMLNNLRHKAGLSAYVEQISRKSDKEMKAMAGHRDLASGLGWQEQVERACRIRLRKAIDDSNDEACSGEADCKTDGREGLAPG